MMLDNDTHALRAIVPDDRALLDGVRLAEHMWAEASHFAHMAADVDKIIEFAYTMRADPNSFCMVAMRGDTCHGFLIGSLAPHGFHDSVFAYDRMLYVTPSMRGSAAARVLIREFEHWAQSKGAVHIMLGSTTGVNSDRVEKFYNKLGYKTVGRLTMKEM